MTIEISRLSLPYAGYFRAQVEAIYSVLQRWAEGDDDIDLMAAAERAWAASAAWSAASAEIALIVRLYYPVSPIQECGRKV